MATEIVNRLDYCNTTSIPDLIGAKVKVGSLTMSNGLKWNRPADEIYTVSDVKFRVTIDGKCHTIVTLAEITDRTFALKDLKLVEYHQPNNDEGSE